MANTERRSIRRGGAAMLAALALTFTMPATGATAASSAAAAPTAASATLQTVSSCWTGGKRIKHFAVKAGSRTVGYVDIRRYSGKGKCAQFFHAGQSKGKARYTSIRVVAGGMSVYNGGMTKTKSPGIKATGLTCITARGTIKWNGKTRSRSVRACAS